jgi:transposase-like protein
VIGELSPAARHITEQYANNWVEADHGRLKARLRPMRGLKRLRSTRVISAGHDDFESRAITQCDLAYAEIEGAAIGAHYNTATFSPRWASQE